MRYGLCIVPAEKEAMKHTEEQTAVRTAAPKPEATQETTVTQITPDDILAAGGPIAAAADDGTPSERQLEQDVVTVNPSADSMESRG